MRQRRTVQHPTPASTSSRFEIETVLPLPAIKTSVTLGAALAGRADDVAFNASIVQAVKKYNVLLPVSAVVSGFCCAIAFFVQNQVTGVSLSVLSCVIMLPVLVVLVASHLRDPVVLTTRSFEFWFTSFLNAAGFSCMCALFSDTRVFACVVSSGFCQIMFILDGNIHARRLLIRLFALGSPLVGAALTAVAIQYTPRLKHATIPLGQGHQGDIVDVVVQCFSTMTIFMAVQVIRSRHFIMPSTKPVEVIQCDVYFPVCHLVPLGSRLGPRARSIPDQQRKRDKNSAQLELVRQDSSIVVDSDNTVLSSLGIKSFCGWIRSINVFGHVGLGCSWIAFVWFIVHSNRSGEPTAYQLIVAMVGAASTVLFNSVYVLHSPIVLLRRLACSLDAWFVSFQFTTVTIGLCDALMWDQRAMLVLPPWLWCHWVMIVDTFTPLTRRRLGFRRGFTLSVLVTLVLYPILVVYWIFYSDAPRLRNRVIISVELFGSILRMEAYSLLVSRVWTVWLWMGRFLWREVFRPADAFKLLKFRVQYQIRPAGLASSSAAVIHPIAPE